MICSTGGRTSFLVTGFWAQLTGILILNTYLLNQRLNLRTTEVPIRS